MIEINSVIDLKPYYKKDIEKGINGYIFNDDINIKCDLNLQLSKLNIYAENIQANNLSALNIWCNNISARSLKADNIYSQKIECTENIKVKNTFSPAECICGYLEASYIKLSKLVCTGVKATTLTAHELTANGIFVSQLSVFGKITAHTIGKKSQANFKIF